jgi:hypothetical protein
MIALGAFYRQEGRSQFPPARREFTLTHFWVALAVGALISCLYNGAMEWIFNEPASP